MGNGNGVADQFQWLFLTFGPARPVAGCPSTIHTEGYPDLLHDTSDRYIIDEPRSLPQCKRRVYVKYFDIPARYFRLDVISMCN